MCRGTMPVSESNCFNLLNSVTNTLIVLVLQVPILVEKYHTTVFDVHNVPKNDFVTTISTAVHRK